MKDKWIILAVTALLIGALFVAGAAGLQQRNALIADMRGSAVAQAGR